MAMRRRELIGATGSLLGTALVAAPRDAAAQASYPDRPVTIIVTFATGGAPHFLARLLAQGLSRALGQPFLVENHGGQGGMSGVCLAAVAPADGHTLMLTTNSVYGPALHLRPCVFDVADAFTPVCLLASTPLALCVPADSGFRDLADLVAAAQAAPGAVRYGTMLGTEVPIVALSDAFDISLTREMSMGPGALVEAVAAGRVHFAVLGLGAALPAVRGGRLRALAVTSPVRSAQLPDVPTMAESGMPDFSSQADFGLFARTGTPEPILARLAEAALARMHQPGMRGLLAPVGLELVGGSRGEFAAYLEMESRRWGAFLQQHDIESLR